MKIIADADPSGKGPRGASTGMACCLSVLLAAVLVAESSRQASGHLTVCVDRDYGSRQRLTNPLGQYNRLFLWIVLMAQATPVYLYTVCGCFCSDIGTWGVDTDAMTHETWNIHDLALGRRALVGSLVRIPSWVFIHKLATPCPAAHTIWGHPVVTCSYSTGWQFSCTVKLSPWVVSFHWLTTEHSMKSGGSGAWPLPVGTWRDSRGGGMPGSGRCAWRCFS